MKTFSKYIAEAVGTFCLVVVGCGSLVVNQLSGGAVTHVGVSLVFGLIVLAMIYSLGPISGAHLNPAVTVGFLSAGRFTWRQTWRYLLAQFAGAVLASLFLKLLFGSTTSVGMTLPSGSWMQSFALEFFLTFLLMFVIMGVATGHREQGVMAGVAIGGTVCLEALLGGPISGASMNPARSWGPALIAQNFQHQWIYLVAPMLGSLVGAKTYQTIQPQESV